MKNLDHDEIQKSYCQQRLCVKWGLTYIVETKKEYIATLSQSFRELDHSPGKWNEHIENFFEQELDRLLVNSTLLYETTNKIGQERAKADK